MPTPFGILDYKISAIGIMSVGSMVMSYAAEFLGTFLLVLSVFASGGNWLVIGATLAIVTLLIGVVSGGHVNPAVSLSAFIHGLIDMNKFIGYIVVQFAGAAAAVYTYQALV
jgi:aquaporin Z